MNPTQSYKRVLIAAELWFGATGAGLAQGFRERGWDVIEVDPHEHFVMGRTRSLRIAAKIIKSSSQRSYNQAIVTATDTLAPTAFISVKGNYIDTETLRHLRSRGVTTAIYYPDFHFDHPGLGLITSNGKLETEAVTKHDRSCIAPVGQNGSLSRESPALSRGPLAASQGPAHPIQP